MYKLLPNKYYVLKLKFLLIFASIHIYLPSFIYIFGFIANIYIGLIYFIVSTNNSKKQYEFVQKTITLFSSHVRVVSKCIATVPIMFKLYPNN